MMEAASKQPATLRFSSRNLEAAFREEYAQESLRQVRWAILLGIVLYGPLFGMMDAVDGLRALNVIWSIRLIVCFVGIGIYLFTFSRHFTRYMQPALSLLLLLGGLGLVSMLMLEETGQQYFDGPALVILATYVAIRLRFIYATSVGWLTTAAYAVIAIAFRDEAAVFLANSIWFMVSANIIGMFAAYGLESFARRVFCQARDLNQKHLELEAARAKATEQAVHLAELDAAKNRFFANVNHELRTPLTLLLGPLRDAIDGRYGVLSGEWGRQLPFMCRSAERLLSLVDHLLDLARLDAGRLRLRIAETDLVALTRRVVIDFATRAEREGLALGFEAFPERLDAWVDSERYEQVLSNLLMNAFKFTPTGGRVRVTLRKNNDNAVLEVRDTGQGIPAEMLPHVFERFRKANDSDTRRHEGVGIGLALVRELVSLHGGEVEVESSIGFGSSFTVHLPLGKDHIEEGALAEAPTLEPELPLLLAPVIAEFTEPAPGGHEWPTTAAQSIATVLVVEDHADMRAYIRGLLLPHYAVVEAEDGLVGLETARSLASSGNAPDLVVSDVMMPGLDGYALCRAMKNDDALCHVPIVLLTARTDVESKLEGLSEGADDYLGKPFSAEELLTRCENLVEVRRRLRVRFSGEVVVKPTDVLIPAEEAAWLEEVMAVCEAHLSDTGFGVDWLADSLGLSTRTLQRRIKAASGLTPGAFLRTMRLKRAVQLFDLGADSVAGVAAAVGYADADSFSRAFRQGFGAPPSVYAERRYAEK